MVFDIAELLITLNGNEVSQILFVCHSCRLRVCCLFKMPISDDYASSIAKATQWGSTLLRLNALKPL